MLFVDKKETFFDYNNKNFSKSQKSPFAKGLTHVLVKKCPFLTLKNRIFPKGLTHAFDQKMAISSLFRFDQNKTRNNA